MTASVASTTGTDSDEATILTHPPSSTTFLQKAPPITYDDFDPREIELHSEQINLIDELEKLWTEFLQADPDVLPGGKKGARIESLEGKLLALQNSKHNVEAELQRQLDFFEKSKEQLEANFERLKMKEEKEQENMMNEMEGRLDAVGTSSRNLEANGGWELFFEALEDAVEQSDVQQLPGNGLSTILGMSTAHSPRGGGGGSTTKKPSCAIKPTAKAMFLNNAATESDLHLRSRDFLLRAFRIDNALLEAEIKTLQRDVERLEQGTKSVDFVGKFLTEQNIWGILSSSSSATQSGRTKNTVAGSNVSRPPSESPQAGAY